MRKIYVLAFIAVGLSIFSACRKDESQVSQQVNDLQTCEVVTKAFQPTNEIKVNNGMLVFESKMAFDVTKLEIANAERKDVDLWEKQLGIKTPARIFQAVVLAEDSVNNYYESLPENEQEYWRGQPEIHSEIYQDALTKQIIHLKSDEDGGEYFDLNLVDNTAASVVNLYGLVMVEGQIFQYTDNAVKIITDGDMSKIEKLKKIDANYDDDNILVMVYDNRKLDQNNQLKSTSFDTDNNWTYDKGWYKINTKTRVKIWIDGHSEMYGAYASADCSEYASCTFVVRAEAQKKNFWGNWKYSSYYPSLSFNATWSYQYMQYNYDPNYPYPCTLYSHAVDNVPAYSCTANPSYMCPTSPHSAYYPSVNNAFINLTPHGFWQLSQTWFSDPFIVSHCSFSGTIDGVGFSYNW